MMITYLTGKITHKEPTYVVMNVGGIGYEIKISLHTFSQIKNLTDCTLSTYLYIKGDVHTLYGFYSIEEKQCWLQLLNVNNIGPRIATTILSSLSPHELQQAIINKNEALIKTIKGVGTKAAQRIVLELYDKVIDLSKDVNTTVSNLPCTPMQQDGLNALIKLGIDKKVAERTIAHILKKNSKEISLETLIKEALKSS